MPRIPFPDPATLPEHMRQAVTMHPSNVTRMLARASEPVFNGFARSFVHLSGKRRSDYCTPQVSF